MHQRMYLCNADGQLAAHLPCNMHLLYIRCLFLFAALPRIFFGGLRHDLPAGIARARRKPARTTCIVAKVRLSDGRS